MPSEDTGLLCLPGIDKHVPWENGYPETCERVLVPFEILRRTGLVGKMKRQGSRSCSLDEMRLCHHEAYISKMESIVECDDAEIVDLCSKFESVNFSRLSFQQAKCVVGSTVDLSKKICGGELKNGLALVRPPSHHSEHYMGANGYCLLNTTAITVRSIQNTFDDVRKVLIFDWDVHHGQGTQSMFYDDPNVLYISIHRYEEAKFYPFLEEANYTYCGTGHGVGRNMNIPFNSAGLGDPEYMHAFMNLVLPVSYEFNPDFVIISAGFDSADGDPKGQMKVTPSCFAHMTHHLQALAGGKLLVLLEGGYNPEVVGHCVEAISRVLISEPVSHQQNFLNNSIIDPTVVEQIQKIQKFHQCFWRCLKDKPELVYQDNLESMSYTLEYDEKRRSDDQKEVDCTSHGLPKRDTAESMLFWRAYWHNYCQNS